MQPFLNLTDRVTMKESLKILHLYSMKKHQVWTNMSVSKWCQNSHFCV